MMEQMSDRLLGMQWHPAWDELRAYLGDRYREEWENGSDQKVLDEFGLYPDAATFYRETEVYLYHSAAYAIEGYKRPHLSRLLMMLGNYNATILDYGCGPGWDGLTMIYAGLMVSFADLPGKSLEFLRWRLNRRSFNSPVYAIGVDAIPRHDIIWCMDALEHIPSAEQRSFLDHLADLGQAVFVNLVRDPDADGTLHHPVDVDGLTAYLRGKHSVGWADYYQGRHRLLVYGDLQAGERLPGSDRTA